MCLSSSGYVYLVLYNEKNTFQDNLLPARLLLHSGEVESGVNEVNAEEEKGGAEARRGISSGF